MNTITILNTLVRSIHPDLDHNLTLNRSGIKITSKSRIKTQLAMATLVAFLSPALAAEISLETAPAVVVKTMPTAGATGVDPALTEIKVTYSKAMQDESWSWSTWGQENYPETTGKPHYLADTRTCVMPVKLQPNKFYAIWLNSDKFKNFRDANGLSAVPYLLTFRTAQVRGAGLAPTASPATTPSELIEREVNQLISDFSGPADLSTPEGACAAWQGATLGREANALSQMSLVPIDPIEQRQWFRREESRDPSGFTDYLKAVAGSKILTVQIWRGELANVITILSFPEGKGRQPYSARCVGLVNGAWKNLGEDRLGDLASAKAGFEKKKERLWQQYSELRDKTNSTARTPDALLNEDQRAVLAWTDRQFRSYFDARAFDGWTSQERTDLESKCMDAFKGPRSAEYFRAINTLAALRSKRGLPELREIAFERVDRNNRDRWMCVRALGLIGDEASVPDLIRLVYHGNVNTRWWAQISLVRITGQNFGKDWNAWGKWWNVQKGEPPYKPEIIRWWNGQPESDKLAQSLDESDAKFLADLKGKSAATQEKPSNELASRLKAAEPTMKGIRENWAATMNALDNGDNITALAAARRVTPHIQEFLVKFRGTSLEAGSAKALDLMKSLTVALEKEDQGAVAAARSALATLGQSMEEQVKAAAAKTTSDPQL